MSDGFVYLITALSGGRGELGSFGSGMQRDPVPGLLMRGWVWGVVRRLVIVALLLVLLAAESGWFWLLGRWIPWTLWALARAAFGL